MIARLILTVSMIPLALVWRPAEVFIIPGVVLLYLPMFKKVDLIDVLIYIPSISCVFWVCSFWFLNLIEFDLLSFVFVVTVLSLGASCAIFIFNVRKKFNSEIKCAYSDLLLGGLFAWLLHLRLKPLQMAIVAGGADMSMHTYISHLIVRANGVPQNYHPILNIDSFNTFPVGFHTLTALVSLLGNIPPYQSSFIMASASFFLLTAGLFLLVKTYVSWKYATVSALLFTFYTANPMDFARWGGNPSILALFFLIMFIHLIDRIEERRLIAVFSSALCLSAVLLTHTIISVTAFYAFGFSFFLSVVAKRSLRSGIAMYALIGVLTAAILSPYLIKLDFGVAQEGSIGLIKKWVRVDIAAWNGTLFDALYLVPSYVKRFLFGGGNSIYPIALIIVVGAIAFFRSQVNKFIQFFFFAVILLFLIVNTQYWVIPLSYLIYPERTAVMMIVSLSVFFALGLKAFCDWLDRVCLSRWTLHNIFAWFALLIAFLAVPTWNHRYVHAAINDPMQVTKEDMRAFDWMERHLKSTDVIANNYQDAGIWIPAILLRPVTNAHVNFTYLNGETGMGEPKYVYVGKACRKLLGCDWNPADLKSRVSEYELVYEGSGAYVFKIIDDDASLMRLKKAELA